MKKFAIAAVVGLGLFGIIYFKFIREDKPAESTDDDAVTTATTPKTPRARQRTERRAENRELSVLVDDDPVGNLQLEGLVLDADDEPVQGAFVTINSNPRQTVKSGEDGTFAIPKLVGRVYRVVARHPAGAIGPVSVRLTKTNDPVILKLRPAGALDVTVVRASDSKPVSGATVELRSMETRSVTTDSDGVARFDSVRPGRYRLAATADGFATAHGRSRVIAGPSPGETTLRMRPGAKVSGIVVDPSGKPIDGAAVLYSGASDWSQRADPRHDAASTGKDGTFEFSGLPAGTFRFTARARGWAPGSSDNTTLDGRSEVRDLRITMMPGAVVRGVVVDKSESPVPGARVRVMVRRSGMMRGRARQAYTDDAGRFEIEGLARKPVEVVAVHESASSAIEDVDLSEAPHEKETTLSLDVDGRISGIVVGTDGEPIEGVQVSAFPDFRSAGRSRRFAFRLRGMPTELTDAGGRFELRGLEPGDYRVRASRAGSGRRAWRSGGEPTRASVGDTDVKIELPQNGSIKGKVALRGGEAPEMFTVATGGFGGGTPFSTKDGKFELPDLAPNTYTLVFRGPEFDIKRVADVEVKEGDTTDIGNITVIKGRSIAGRVLSPSGSPVADALVSAGRMVFGSGSSSEAQGGPPWARGAKRVRSDDNGNYIIRGIGAGDVSVLAEHETDGRSIAILLRASADSYTDINLQLKGFGSLEGKVTKNGEAVEQVFVNAASLTSPDVTFGVATGPDGSYRFDKLAPDEYKVSAMLGRNPMQGFAYHAKAVTVVTGQTAKLDLNATTGSVSLTAGIKAAEDKDLGFTWVTAVKGSMSAANARELNLKIGSTPEGLRKDAFSIMSMPAVLTELVPGSYTVCAAPYPAEVRGMRDTMGYMQRQGDKLPVFCKELDVAESPEEQTMSLTVTVPEFVPVPDES